MTQCNDMFLKIGESITTPGRKEATGGLNVRQETQWKEIVMPPSVKQTAFREGFPQGPRLQELIFRERLVPLETVGGYHICDSFLSETASRVWISLCLYAYPDKERAKSNKRDKEVSIASDYKGILPTTKVCIVRLTHERSPPKTQSISCIMLSPLFPEEDSESESMDSEDGVAVNILDAQFYDDKQLVLVLQTVGTADNGIISPLTCVCVLTQCLERRAIVMLNFVDQEYQPITVLGPSLDIEADIIQQFDGGMVRNPIYYRLRVLISFKLHTQTIAATSSRLISMRAASSTVSLAVNNKRSVAIILDHDRCIVQAYDLASEEEDDATVDESREQESVTPTEAEESMET